MRKVFRPLWDRSLFPGYIFITAILVTLVCDMGTSLPPGFYLLAVCWLFIPYMGMCGQICKHDLNCRKLHNLDLEYKMSVLHDAITEYALSHHWSEDRLAGMFYYVDRCGDTHREILEDFSNMSEGEFEALADGAEARFCQDYYSSPASSGAHRPSLFQSVMHDVGHTLAHAAVHQGVHILSRIFLRR